jgi:hypothetical protein
MDNMGHDVTTPVNAVLLITASVTGSIGTYIGSLSSDDLDRIDKISGIGLKWISILSFAILIAINIGTIVKMISKCIKSWFK